MAKKNADILAVAKAAKVSPSTVSRSFNHPELVNAATRKRIDKAVRRLGYIRNRAAQTIHGIRSGTIGLVVPTIDHAIFAELIQSFSEGVEAFGFTILVATHGYDLEREYAVVRKMMEHRVDGLAMIGLDHTQDTFDLIDSQNVPSLLLWNHSDGMPLASVGASNADAGELIARHVLDCGHRDIATVFPPLRDNDRAMGRYYGVERMCHAAGLLLRPDWQLEAPYSVNDGKAAGLALLGQSARPSVILCGNDVLAWGVCHAARKLGLDVPSDVSVTGIGDFAGSRDMEPALTTVRLPARQIGAQAAQSIARAITEPDCTSVSVKVPCELMVRDTCRNLNRS